MYKLLEQFSPKKRVVRGLHHNFPVALPDAPVPEPAADVVVTLVIVLV